MSERGEGPWLLAEIEGDDGAYLVRLRTDLPTDAARERWPVLVRIIWAFGGESGPDDATYERMTTMENALFQATRVEQWAVGVAAVTTGDEKEWLFYTDDAEAFVTHLSDVLADHPRYPIDIHAAEDADWQALTELLPPDTLH